jgi:large subunit ribosomal protein L5
MAKDTGKPKKGGHGSKAAADAPMEPLPKPRLKELFETKVRAAVKEQFGLANPMQCPRLEKIVLNVNMGRHLEGTKLPPNVKNTVLETLVKISGQKPVVLKAKKSVSNFKVREGYETAAMVTLRRERMWYFLDRLIHLATPRIKDFRGVSDKAFDKQGNYAMGLTEQGVFPEIDMTQAVFTHGMHINMVFAKSNPQLSKFVLDQLGMPFKKPEPVQGKAS